jgi:mannosyl-oligosaccharide alpha-1,3-glucosidase
VLLTSGQVPAQSASLIPATDSFVTKLTANVRRGIKTAYLRYTSADGIDTLLAIGHNPFSVQMFLDTNSTLPGIPVISVNDRGLLHYEHRRAKPGDAGTAAVPSTDPHPEPAAATKAEREVIDWDEAGQPIYADSDEVGEAEGDTTVNTDTPKTENDDGSLWTERFGTHTDSKPYGPMSVGVDITFPFSTHVYGIPEHASSLSLHATDGSDENKEYTQPYRLYNLDVFEYELDNPMALYGSIPFMLAHGPSGVTSGVYWNNPTETYVDIAKPTTTAGAPAGSPSTHVTTRWISESGVWDLSLIPGPLPKSVMTRYTSLVGTQALPPLFALGYHQCRWNYKDEADVYAVDAKFEELSFPYDVIWLDIEHTDGKRYFTWDSRLFPSPAAMQDKLAARGHKMVTIIDPHIKKDTNYRIHSEAQAKNLYVKSSSNGEYDGWCWPGSSGYLDFTSPTVREWWADQFSLSKYIGSTLSLYTWNDMNEPSVFNGPEVSMHKDALSLAGIEHREWHNLYGFYQQSATAMGQTRRSPTGNARPFVLSRAFFAGSQRYGAIWTGDNAAKWEHLAIASPMLLSIGSSGLAFAGADVGGFFGNPAPELLRRWYAAGSFTPFFRAHAHIDTQRREPWLFGDEVLDALRTIVRTRYTYLQFWYTLFAQTEATGVPPMRPIWVEFPTETSMFATDDAWMVGDALLVKPVTTAGATSITITLPGASTNTLWYDADTYTMTRATGTSIEVAAPITKLPVWQRGGSIVPRQMRARRSSVQMSNDPYTLIVTLDSKHMAQGHLYLDDGFTLDYARKGAYRMRNLTYTPSQSVTNIHTLRCGTAGGGKVWAPTNLVERIIIVGIHQIPKSIIAIDGDASIVTIPSTNEGKRMVEFDYDKTIDILTIRKPDMKIAYDWTLFLEF